MRFRVRSRSGAAEIEVEAADAVMAMVQATEHLLEQVNRDAKEQGNTSLRLVVVSDLQAGAKLDVLIDFDGLAAKHFGVTRVVAKPGSITPQTKFNAEAYVLTKEEGGRHTPFFNGYRPQFYFRTTDVTGVVKLPEGTEMVMPGDNINVEIDLITPVAMDQGLKFAIREGGRTVGAGVVTKIIQ